jgi:hypothetical protein
MYRVVEAIVKSSNGELASVVGTDVEKLLTCDEFKIILSNSVNKHNQLNTSKKPLTIKKVMDGDKQEGIDRIPDSMWDIASVNLAKEASGHIKNVSFFASSDSIFVKSELPNLLKNPNVESIDGISRKYLNNLLEKKSFDKVVEKVKLASSRRFELLAVTIDDRGEVIIGNYEIYLVDNIKPLLTPRSKSSSDRSTDSSPSTLVNKVAGLHFIREDSRHGFDDLSSDSDDDFSEEKGCDNKLYITTKEKVDSSPIFILEEEQEESSAIIDDDESGNKLTKVGSPTALSILGLQTEKHKGACCIIL